MFKSILQWKINIFFSKFNNIFIRSIFSEKLDRPLNFFRKLNIIIYRQNEKNDRTTGIIIPNLLLQ